LPNAFVFTSYVYACRELYKRLVQQRISRSSADAEQPSKVENKALSSDGETSIVPYLENKPVMGAKQRFIRSGGYLKGWLRGLDISAYKSAPGGTLSNSDVAEVIHSSTDSDVSISRYVYIIS
jgi:hypothetical protein